MCGILDSYLSLSEYSLLLNSQTQHLNRTCIHITQPRHTVCSHERYQHSDCNNHWQYKPSVPKMNNNDYDEDRQAIQVHHFFIINALNIRDAYHMKFNQQAIAFKCDMMNIQFGVCMCVRASEDKSTSVRETVEFGFSGIKK